MSSLLKCCLRSRNGAIAARTEGDVSLYALGTGDYDELCCTPHACSS